MLASLLINTLIIALVVLIHYEFLSRLSAMIPKFRKIHRVRILIGLFGSLLAHIIEIWFFALGYYFMVRYGEFGTLTGNFSSTLIDCVYFSFVTYTSLGVGDIIPLGNIRFLAGLEALTGLVLITWTASFLFIEMRHYWDEK